MSSQPTADPNSTKIQGETSQSIWIKWVLVEGQVFSMSGLVPCENQSGITIVLP